jgi:hypothetical protein
MSKAAFPPIGNEIRRQRIDVALRPRAELPDEEVEARSRAIGEKWGAATQLRSGESTGGAPPLPAAPLVSVRFDCPDYLDKELSVKAAEQGVTKTYLILQALGTAGYRMDVVDLIKDRRRQRK